MTFAIIETSVDGGKPVEMLLINYLTQSWAYTTSETNEVHDGHTFAPLPISHTALKQNGDVAKSTITVKVPKDCAVGELFRAQSPSGVVSLTLFVKHAGDTDVKTFWKGRIVNSEREDPWLNLTVENVFSSMKRMGLRRKSSTQCQLPVYGIGEGMCNADREAFKKTLVVASVNGAVVGVTGAGAWGGDYFAGGYATWNHATEGYLEQRMVTTSDLSGNVTFVTPPKGIVVGQTITLYPGCDHMPDTCHVRFGNKLNYGGMEYMPRKNPFAGTTLY